MEASKRSNVIVLASVAAAAASIAVVIVVARWRQRSLHGKHGETNLRGVQDVLADCYRKISDIERDLPMGHAPGVGPDRASYVDKMSRMVFNGSPAMGT